MRIDGTSLIAAQSVSQARRTHEALPAAAQQAGKPLFEPLNFPKSGPEPAPSKPAEPGARTGAPRPGGQLDITV